MTSNKICIERIGEGEYAIGESRVKITDGAYIVYHVIAIGEQTAEVSAAHGELIKETLSKSNKKVQFLIDLNHCGKNSPQARDCWRTYSLLETTTKVAIFGMHPVSRMIASFVMGKISKIEHYRFFSTEDEARDWFNE
ncbi:DUF7793 family protein [Plebeiibacterium sediminum]|uniref:STAS/SEC14 domain-containing protein n=1 Tax=Plebeiibacterium sediminum TaxID=2992112 RepID=A0AAE3M8T1_9BACT|nr:STAS/SEC14 domain-containing protein [Plebeiobacterium sediminum]MCW3788680.1 hypothetical protein [Plebeiobacterium sediminum]